MLHKIRTASSLRGPLNAVAFTAAFLAQAAHEGVTETELSVLVQVLSTNPRAGDMIVGSGGCRKMRLARKGGGKSGGYRVVTFFASADRPVCCIACLAKNSRANFTDDESKAMAKFAAAIKQAGRKRTA